jgi:hypothetical protein
VVEARPGTTRSPSPGELPERRAEELPERHTASQGKSLSADSSMMIHPSQRTLPHADYHQWVLSVKSLWTSILEADEDDPDHQELVRAFRTTYSDLARTANACLHSTSWSPGCATQYARQS